MNLITYMHCKAVALDEAILLDLLKLSDLLFEGK